MSNSSGSASSYDQSPYESLPFFYSRPEHLSAIGRLFGMNPPALATARVLELGAAAGGSLITFAARYPQSKSLGIDLSVEQIAHGQAQVRALGLNNLELKAMSLMDITQGQFDYIICHGVYSWVADLEREKILEIAARNLSPNGIAFISYNTLPGWNQMATLRDMLQFHTARFEELADKVEQAKMFLGFVGSAVADGDDSHSRFLCQEAADLQDKPESYLLHEYLIGENQPFYFIDFMRAAAEKGLHYLADSHIATMTAGDLPESVGATLEEVGDIVQREQYLDFLTNRRFRSSLLCHAQVKRTIAPAVMEELFFSMDVECGQELLDYRDDSEVLEFSVSGGKACMVTAGTSVMKALMLSFMEFRGREVTVEDLLQNVLSMLPELAPESLREELLTMLVTLVSKEVARPVAAPCGAISTISARPRVSELVRLQAQNPRASWVSNEVNEPIAIDGFGRLALPFMNGEHTREQMVGLLVEAHMATGEVDPEADQELVAEVIGRLLDELLEEMRCQFLLVA